MRSGRWSALKDDAVRHVLQTIDILKSYDWALGKCKGELTMEDVEIEIGLHF